MEQEIQEIRAELKKIAEVGKENNAILRGIRSRERWALAYGIIRWVIFIALAISAYYYLQPYLEQLSVVYQKVTGTKMDFLKMFRGF